RFPRQLRQPVRLLHPRHDPDRQGAARPQPLPQPRGDRRRDLRQPLPLHGLRADHSRHRIGGRVGRTLMALDEKTYSVIGKSVQKIDGLGHVTAQTRYVDDLRFPDLQYTAMHRSPYPHARILRIDTSAAERLPGVAAVVTHRDVANNLHGLLAPAVEPDEPLLAEHEVCYVGQPIAAVAAADVATAREAAALIQVEYEELPAVFDPRESVKPGAPPVRTAYGVYPNYYVYAGHPCRRVRYGDVEAALARADHLVHGTYRIRPIEHAPLETQVSVSVPDPSAGCWSTPPPRRCTSRWASWPGCWASRSRG